MVTSPSNTRSIIVDGICTTAMSSFFVGPFLAAFALALGATHWEIGLIATIAFLSLPMQLVGLYAVDRWKQRRALIVCCGNRADSVDSNRVPTIRSRESLCAFLADGTGL